MGCPHLPRAQRNNELVSPLVIVRTCEHIMVYGQSHWALLMFCLGPAQAEGRGKGQQREDPPQQPLAGPGENQ